MIRFLRIANRQLRGLALADFLALVKLLLFRDDPVFIYALDTSQVEKIEDNALGVIDIRKGNIGELEENNMHYERVPWEFRCHEYDGVKDFFVATDCEGIQHISWIYYQNDHNRFIRLGHADAEIKYCLTLPPFRGQGLYPIVLKTIVRHLSSEGFHRVFICVHKDNQPSIRGIEKAGFKRIGRIRFIKVIGVQLSERYVPREV